MTVSDACTKIQSFLKFRVFIHDVLAFVRITSFKVADVKFIFGSTY